MIKKFYTGWMNLPALLIGFSLIGCSINSGESFVLYKDQNMNTYRDSSLPPVHLVNNQNEHANYYKKDDAEPIRIDQPKSKDNLPPSNEEKITQMESEFKMACSNELLDNFINKYAPNELAFIAVQKIAQPFIDDKDWSGASDVFTKYRDKFPSKSIAFSKINSILTAPSQNVVISNLGPGVNSSENEYSPVISSNGKKLLFARDCGACGGGEEVYVTNQNKSGFWSSAEKFGPPLSSSKNETPLALSVDGNTLAVFGNYEGSLGRGDIFHIDKTVDSWSPIQHYPPPLNSENFESNAMFTSDGKAILFVSDRPGGVGEFHPKGSFYHGDYNGNTDIYVYLPDASGGGQVINLGATINTAYSEYSPFLHPDGKTLYFSSNGHPGLGGLDVFKSTRLNENSWTEWSEPENLGKDINTTANDWGYQFVASGNKAYFSTENRPDSLGGSDIYSVTIPKNAQPSAVISISGKVTDPQGNILSADIRWNDLDLGKEVGHLTSDPQTGEYIIHLPSGRKYIYYAEKSGYMGESQNLDFTNDLGYQEFVMDIVLHPIINQSSDQSKEHEPVATIKMNNIFFDFDKSTLRNESTAELDRWIRMLKENDSITIEVDGYTDSIGSDQYNLKLSEQRAISVVKYLSAHGIDLERLETKGFGKKNPISSNKTSEGRQQNRRVEVKIFNN